MSRRRRSMDEHFKAALAGYKEAKEEKKKIKDLDLKGLEKKFKKTCDQVKRETQILMRDKIDKRRAGTTRSGKRRGVVEKVAKTSGKIVNKGLDEAAEPFDESEITFLKDAVAKVKKVDELKYEHLKYLVMNVFQDDLNSIKDGELESDLDKRFKDLVRRGKSATELGADIYLGLFKSEQTDYIRGLLQGIFVCDKDGVKHDEDSYASTVLVAEVTIRIVRYVMRFASNEEAHNHMVQQAREACGFDPDDWYVLWLAKSTWIV